LLKRLAKFKADALDSQHGQQTAIRSAMAAAAAMHNVPATELLPGQDMFSQADAKASMHARRLRQHLVAIGELELEELSEEEWGDLPQQRDGERRALVAMLAVQEAGWLAKQTCLDQVVSSWVQPDELRAAATQAQHPPVGSTLPPSAQSGTGAAAVHAELVSATASMEALVGEVDMEAQAAWAQARGIAERVLAEGEGRKRAAEADLAECARRLREMRPLLRAHARAQQRRDEAEGLLRALGSLQGDFKAAGKQVKKAVRKKEDLMNPLDSDEDGLPEDHTEVVSAGERLQTMQRRSESLARQREALIAAITALAIAEPNLSRMTEDEDEDAATSAVHRAATGDLVLEFPELAVRAQRSITPFTKRPAEMSPRDRSRWDVETLLRRDGLLAEARSLDDYSEEQLPEVMIDATSTKPNVMGKRLRGVHGEAGLVILKEIPTAEYKTVKRAVVTAHRLNHRGVVPIDCCFVDARRDVVIMQSRFHSGGNMRQWMAGKDHTCLLRAAHRIAQAVAFLHGHGTLHRDIKPENIVFDGEQDDAHPALCDFDLSVDMSSDATMTSTTFMRGTLLYMPPGDIGPPSPARDVFALGVTLLDTLFFGGEPGRLPTTPTTALPGVRLDVDAAQRGLESTEPLPVLVRKMISLLAEERPSAADVTTEIAMLVAKLDAHSCVICAEEYELCQGLLCNAAVGDDAHFVCDECMSGDVHHRQSSIITADDQQIRCCMTPQGCESRPFAYQDVARHCTAEAFRAFQRRLGEIQETTLERQVEARVKAVQDELLAKSALEMEVMIARKHIEEDIMLLRCPNGACRRAFADFNGCAALTCRGEGGEAGCGANFCGFCLVDCGADAHRHVANCRLNPKGDWDPLFPPAHVWQRAQQQRRQEKLQPYWDGLKDSVRRQLGHDASVRQIFTDLGLPLPPEASAAGAAVTQAQYPAQVAQLRGMFPRRPQEELRAAVEAAAGDVDAAAGMLVG
jgi:serine/threonine protein kinase